MAFFTTIPVRLVLKSFSCQLIKKEGIVKKWLSRLCMEGEETMTTMGIPQLVLSNTLLLNGALFLGIVGLHSMIDDAQIDGKGVSVALLALALALLIKSADVFIEGAKGLAYRAGLPEVVIGLTIVSIGTSLPEILVTSTAAADIPNNPAIADLAIGGIYGSILVQITLILGVVVAFRGVKIRPSWLKRDGMIMMSAIALLTLFLFTGDELNRIEGSILISLYVAYIYWLLSHREEILEDEMGDSEPVERRLNRTTASYAVMVTLGLLLALFAAHHLVTVASGLAVAYNVPHAVIGTTVSGLGTSLPELAIAFMAAKRSEGVAIGTLIGSNITDPLLSIGIAAVVNPLALTPTSYDLTAYLIIPATFIGTGIALAMMRSQYEFKRWEGVVLIAIYLVFMGLLLAEQQGILVL
jgi:cation:H+ antiporter